MRYCGVRLMWLKQCGTRSYNRQGAGNSSYMRCLLAHRSHTGMHVCDPRLRFVGGGWRHLLLVLVRRTTTRVMTVMHD
jgi:hypothetical protein